MLFALIAFVRYHFHDVRQVTLQRFACPLQYISRYGVALIQLVNCVGTDLGEGDQIFFSSSCRVGCAKALIIDHCVCASPFMSACKDYH